MNQETKDSKSNSRANLKAQLCEALIASGEGITAEDAPRIADMAIDVTDAAFETINNLGKVNMNSLYRPMDKE